MKRDFSHLANCTPAQWGEVCSIINAPRFAEGWARAFARATGTSSPTTATDPPRSAAQAASVASWKRAFEKAGASRRK